MKIDTSKIEGYEQMSAEEKLQALEMYELDTTGYVKKDVFDKTSSEVATLKKQLKERMTQEELQDALLTIEQMSNTGNPNPSNSEQPEFHDEDLDI